MISAAITRKLYDAADRVTEIDEGVNGAASERAYAKFSYYDNGTIDKVTDAKGNVAEYHYDGFDRKSAWNLPSTTTPGTVSATADTWTYNPDGTTSVYHVRGVNNVNYGYDNLARVTSLGYATDNIYYTYDALDRMLTARRSSNSETTTYTYDGSGDVLTEANALGTITSLYDANGNRTQVTYPASPTNPNGSYFAYSYDTPGRLSQILENGSTANSATIARFHYDQLGRRIDLTRGAGSGMIDETTYTFDDAGDLSQLHHNVDYANSHANQVYWTFTRDRAGGIAKRLHSICCDLSAVARCSP